MAPESEHKSTKMKKKDKNVLLLFTYQQEMLNLMIKCNQLVMEILLYGDKENERGN